MEGRINCYWFVAFVLLTLPVMVQSISIPYGNYSFEPDNGYFKIIKDGLVVSRFGFAITASINNNDYTKTSLDFNWTYTQDGDDYTAWNQLTVFNWTANYDISNGRVKISHIITNNFINLSNGKFWYVQTIDKDGFVYWSGDAYPLNVTRHLQGDFTNIIPNINFLEDYVFDYSDLIANNFKITDIYVGNGSFFDESLVNINILAIGVTKGNGNFNIGQRVILDPEISGCTETASTIHCDDGSFSGNSLDTNKNISINRSTINAGADDGLLRLNSTGGWINITNSYIHANSTGAFSNDGTINILNIPQNLYITNSHLESTAGTDDNSGGTTSCLFNSTGITYLQNFTLQCIAG